MIGIHSSEAFSRTPFDNSRGAICICLACVIVLSIAIFVKLI